MDKAKAQSLREVLSDVFANVEGREKYIKKRLEEICSRDKCQWRR